MAKARICPHYWARGDIREDFTVCVENRCAHWVDAEACCGEILPGKIMAADLAYQERKEARFSNPTISELRLAREAKKKESQK